MASGQLDEELSRMLKLTLRDFDEAEVEGAVEDWNLALFLRGFGDEGIADDGSRLKVGRAFEAVGEAGRYLLALEQTATQNAAGIEACRTPLQALSRRSFLRSAQLSAIRHCLWTVPAIAAVGLESRNGASLGLSCSGR